MPGRKRREKEKEGGNGRDPVGGRVIRLPPFFSLLCAGNGRTAHARRAAQSEQSREQSTEQSTEERRSSYSCIIERNELLAAEKLKEKKKEIKRGH